MFIFLMLTKEQLLAYVKYGLLPVRVIPNSSRQDVVEESGKVKVYLQAVPDKNKANLELIKLFKKHFGVRVKIKQGERSREKVLMIT